MLEGDRGEKLCISPLSEFQNPDHHHAQPHLPPSTEHQSLSPLQRTMFVESEKQLD